MTSLEKNIFSVLLLTAVSSNAAAWWDPGHLVDISSTNLYGITAAFKAEIPGVDKVAIITERSLAPDRAAVLAATGGFPWVSGPFGLFLVDATSGAVIKNIAIFNSVSPGNAMPELKAAGPGFATITQEDADSGVEISRRKYFFNELSTAPAVTQGYKPIGISSILRFKKDLFFTGRRGESGIILRLGLKDERPVPEDWELIDRIDSKPLAPVTLSKTEGDTVGLYTPSETYRFDGKSWTRIPGPDPRYFRPAQDPCSGISTEEIFKDFSLYEKCDKERYVQGDAALVGYEGRCETENPGSYAWLHKSYTGVLERHALSDRLIDISKKPLRRFFVWNSAAGYEEKPATGVYEIKGDSCKFYPMPVPDGDILKRYRPDRAEQGCGINDKLGPFQKLGDRVWFCKNFYGGEGQCGVGAAGFFDMKAKKFEIFYSSQTAKWSCSALLAEEKTVWLGLEHIGEGWGKSGGLAALDPATGEVKIFDIPAGITAIRRVGDLLFLGTGEGIYTLNEKGESTRIALDVDKDGNYKLGWD